MSKPKRETIVLGTLPVGSYDWTVWGDSEAAVRRKIAMNWNASEWHVENFGKFHESGFSDSITVTTLTKGEVELI